MRRFLLLVCLSCGCLCPAVFGQSSCAPSSKLFCLVPNQLGVPSSEFAALNEAVGVVVSNLPLASPAAGVIYITDPKLNLPVPSGTTLGPILTQRPETVGRHRMYFAAVYQHFSFKTIDGISLRNIPAVTKTTDLAFVTSNNLNLTVSQTTGYFTFGLIDRVDFSVAVPILDVHEQFVSNGSKFILNSPVSTQPTPISVSNAASASGIGDIILVAKAAVWRPSYGGLAIGVEVRAPSGDALNFLGSGAVGAKPYSAIAFGKRLSGERDLGYLSLHANVGYQLNGNTALVKNSSGREGQLPNALFFSEGVDWGVRRWITLAADVLSERVFDSGRIIFSTSSVNADTFTTIASSSSSYNRTDGSAGIKFKPYRNLTITGNALIKLDQGGLRARIVPLAGLSYTF